MTQKLLDRSAIAQRLSELDKLLSINPDSVQIERLPALIEEQHSATGERDRLLLILKQLDKRESADIERDRVASIEKEIQQLTIESNAFQASLPDVSKEIQALSIVLAESLSSLQSNGRRANFAKSRIFYLQRQLEGKHIEKFDRVPLALHLPDTISVPLLVQDPRPGILFHTGSPWVLEQTTIEKVLEDKSLGVE